MSWGNSCYTLPRIRNHAEAEAFFNGISPLRSSTWAANERPLGRRADHNKRIVRHAFHGTDTYVYELTLYNTPLATYRPNGEVHIVRYDTRMSRDFLDAVLPVGLSTISHGGTTMIRANTPNGPAWYLGGKGALEFEHCGHNWWRLNSTPQARMREHLCRKQAAAVRKAAKPFLDWVQAHRALLGTDQLLWLAWVASTSVPKTFEQLQDVQAWPELEPYVGNRAQWMQVVYGTLGARTEHAISNYEPPKRGRSREYS